MKYIGVIETFSPQYPGFDCAINHSISFRSFKTLKDAKKWAENLNYPFKIRTFKYGPRFENEKTEKIDYQAGKIYKNGRNIAIVYLIPEKKLDVCEFKHDFVLDIFGG